MSILRDHWWVVGLALAIVVALISPLASGDPDGLERVAEDQGFIDRAQAPPFQIIADYLFPGVESEAIATMLAGVIGTAVMFGLGYLLARLLRRRTAGIT